MPVHRDVQRPWARGALRAAPDRDGDGDTHTNAAAERYSLQQWLAVSVGLLHRWRLLLHGIVPVRAAL
jgi:hypothetical protein